MKDYQSILFPYAYNILGRAEDARDAVQDVLYRQLSGQQKEFDNEKAYLIKAVINQSINIKEKNKKIRYGDEWLPEPIATEETDKAIQLNDIAAYSLLILLEKLNPKERAVFILKEGFGYAHEEIAEVLSATVENSRQLLSRAKRKLDADKQISIKEVIDLMLLVYTRFQATASFVPTVINHQPAFLCYRNEKLFLCQIFGFSSDGKITQINNVLDPQKLKGLKPYLNLLNHE